MKEHRQENYKHRFYCQFVNFRLISYLTNGMNNKYLLGKDPEKCFSESFPNNKYFFTNPDYTILRN